MVVNRSRRLVAVLGLTLTLSACGSAGEGLVIVGSAPGTIGTGPQRVILAWLDAEQNPLGGPDQPITAVFTRNQQPYAETPGEWVWSIEGVRGFYVAYVDFDQPGTYQVTIRSEDGRPTPPSPFEVAEVASVPEIGQLPPRSVTKTSPPQELADITTDPNPEPAFYQVTVAEAMTSGEPSIIVFASPALCQTATCGPTLDIVKQVAAAHPGLRVVHVEVYDNLDATGAGELQVVPAVNEWNLPSEPWVYVLGPEGRVAGRFEGSVSASEIEDVLTFLES